MSKLSPVSGFGSNCLHLHNRNRQKDMVFGQYIDGIDKYFKPDFNVGLNRLFFDL
jgi:hypothetical protein